MRACKNCRFGERATDSAGATFYFCRLIPPQPVMVGADVQWVQPPMKPVGWCGQFKLAFWRWLKNSAARAT